jgi:hypothetical protein
MGTGWFLNTRSKPAPVQGVAGKPVPTHGYVHHTVSQSIYIFAIDYSLSLIATQWLHGSNPNALPSLVAPKVTELRDELDCYLSTDPEYTTDMLGWWYEHCASFPQLSCMALDYLSTPGKPFSSTQDTC